MAKLSDKQLDDIRVRTNRDLGFGLRSPDAESKAYRDRAALLADRDEWAAEAGRLGAEVARLTAKFEQYKVGTERACAKATELLVRLQASDAELDRLRGVVDTLAGACRSTVGHLASLSDRAADGGLVYLGVSLQELANRLDAILAAAAPPPPDATERAH